jgi:hypothetical protein
MSISVVSVLFFRERNQPEKSNAILRGLPPTEFSGVEFAIVEGISRSGNLLSSISDHVLRALWQRVRTALPASAAVQQLS